MAAFSQHTFQTFFDASSVRPGPRPRPAGWSPPRAELFATTTSFVPSFSTSRQLGPRTWRLHFLTHVERFWMPRLRSGPPPGRPPPTILHLRGKLWLPSILFRRHVSSSGPGPGGGWLHLSTHFQRFWTPPPPPSSGPSSSSSSSSCCCSATHSW